jgi:hypothetical protein
MKKLGLAVGGVPVVLRDSRVVAVGLHCKTDKAPSNVTLGRSDSGDVLRPSPFQLKRLPDKSLKPRTDCVGELVNTLVAVDGVQNGPQQIGTYDPAVAIPLAINIDQTGPRTEEAVLYEVSTLEQAKSVFGDGAYVTIEIGTEKAFVEGAEIPAELLKAWAAGDDSAPMNHALDFRFNGKAINMVVPAAVLVLFLMKS